MLRKIDDQDYNKSKARNRIVSKPIFVKEKAPMIKILLDNILCIEAFGTYVSIKTHNDRLTVHSTMKDIENMLPPDKFIRVHRSYIVAVDKINAINNKTLEVDRKLIPVSESYKQALLDKLKYT